MLLDLVLLGLLRAERDRLQREEELSMQTPAAVTPLGLPPDPTAPRFPEDPSDPV
jgi:hypothetical protein